MAIREETVAALAAVFDTVRAHLDERQRRLLLGAGAQVLGHGGIRAVARAAGAREGTVARGLRELERGEALPGRVRGPGGGRKRAADLDAGLRPALLALVEPEERGDPMSPLRWTTKSTRTLAAELTRQGHRVSADTVADLLREEDFSLQANAKTIEGRQHPDRDGQFGYINQQAKDFQAASDPVISADAGGSNSYRTRAWKTELAALATQAGLEITVCHFPPGTSKWNKIEHRLFAHITTNWRGRPLTSHQVIVNSIAATTTRTGLTVRAQLDTLHLCHRGADQRSAAGRLGGDAPRLARRLELHPGPRTTPAQRRCRQARPTDTTPRRSGPHLAARSRIERVDACPVGAVDRQA